jgi:hypothetical protein
MIDRTARDATGFDAQSSVAIRTAFDPLARTIIRAEGPTALLMAAMVSPECME